MIKILGIKAENNRCKLKILSPLGKIVYLNNVPVGAVKRVLGPRSVDWLISIDLKHDEHVYNLTDDDFNNIMASVRGNVIQSYQG